MASAVPPIPPPQIPKALESVDPRTFLTRFQVAEALEACGIPLSYDTLATKATRGGGPPFRIFGKSAVYQWADVVAWVREAMGEPACTTSEHRARHGTTSAPPKPSPDRAARRADKLRARLGWEPGILNGDGGKPKWMRWSTFEGLAAEHDQLVRRSMQAAVLKFGPLVSDFRD